MLQENDNASYEKTADGQRCHQYQQSTVCHYYNSLCQKNILTGFFYFFLKQILCNFFTIPNQYVYQTGAYGLQCFQSRLLWVVTLFLGQYTCFNGTTLTEQCMIMVRNVWNDISRQLIYMKRHFLKIYIDSPSAISPTRSLYTGD